MCIRQALGHIESAFLLELTEVGTCHSKISVSGCPTTHGTRCFPRRTSSADKVQSPPLFRLVRPQPFARTVSIPEALYVSQV